MNKKELKKHIEGLPYSAGLIVDTIKINRNGLLKLIEQLDEPQKPVVPQFMADWIKKNEGSLFGLNYDSVSSEIYDWVYEEEGNLKKLHLACAIGYTVEKEKRYEVILCNGQSLKTVYRQGEDRLDFEKVYGDLERFTRKQLEEAGFGWVFDCKGIAVKEVE